jgi:hypothetical protein
MDGEEVVEEEDDVQRLRNEHRKRVICIAASIIVARHIKQPDDPLKYRPSVRTEALIENAIMIGKRILERIENAIV